MHAEHLAALGIHAGARDGAAFDGIAFFSRHHHAAAQFERGSGIGIRRLQLHSLLVARCHELRWAAWPGVHESRSRTSNPCSSTANPAAIAT